jgi:hypothetical protein
VFVKKEMKRQREEECYIVWPVEILWLILRHLYTRLVKEFSFTHLQETRTVSWRVRELIDRRIVPAIKYIGGKASDAIFVNYARQTMAQFQGLESLKLGEFHKHILREYSFSSLRTLVTPDSLNLRQRIPEMTSLTRLSLQRCDRFPDYIFTPLTALRELRICRIAFFPRLGNMSSLVKLKVDYRCCRILPDVNELSLLTNLEVLRLYGPHSPRLFSLTRLCKLRAHVAAEKDLLALSNLTSLSPGSRSVVHGSTLSQLSQLRNLDITALTTTTTLGLSDIVTLTNLRSLKLNWENEKDVKFLAEHLPHCCVKF